jgi:hypothetical protein
MSSETGDGATHGRMRRWRSVVVDTVLAGAAVIALWLIARATGPD